MKPMKIMFARLLALAFVCAFAAAGAANALAAGAKVRMETSAGIIVLAMDEERAPQTAANFIQYAEDGFFDGLLFHRVIAGFVIQGGGFEPGMQMRQTRPPVAFEETGLPNVKYSISMARTNDPNSATSQFFINLNDNAQLDGNYGLPGYAVFGRVVEGMEVVDAIAAAKTKTIPHPAYPDNRAADYKNVPVEDIIIIKAEVQKEEEQ